MPASPSESSSDKILRTKKISRHGDGIFIYGNVTGHTN